MEQQTRNTDPKIIVALISGTVTIVVTLIPLLTASERNVFLLSLVSILALVLVSTLVIVLVRRRRFRLMAGLMVFAGIFAAAALTVNGLIPLSPRLRYTDTSVTVYAGTGERSSVDGTLDECSFVSPRSMSPWRDTLYLTDSDRIRVIENGEVRTLEFPSNRYNPLAVRCRDADVFVLAQTRRQEGDDGHYYTVFLRLRGGEARMISEPLEMGAYSGSVPDFAFSRGGVLWFIRLYFAPGGATATLEKLPYDRDTDTYGAPEWAMDLPYAASDMRDARMIFDESDNLYLSVPGQGVVLWLPREEPECRIFAGTEGERVSNDRRKATFSYPTSLAVDGGFLYVLDNGVVRRLPTEEPGALDRALSRSASRTMAGVPPEEVNDPNTQIHFAAVGETVAGDETAFSADELASLAVDGRGRLLLSDPENSLIYQIRENPEESPKGTTRRR